ncbi:MAG: OsmC family protein [Polyangiaceae bacterium]|jgi:putative redox protein
MSRLVSASTALSGKFRQNITVGPHTLIGDESTEAGGDDAGPEPHEYLLAALASCTSMTVKMYTDRKGWPLRSVRVDVTGARKDQTYAITRTIHLDGGLDAEQRARVLDVANKCPVHRTLTGKIEITSELAG